MTSTIKSRGVLPLGGLGLSNNVIRVADASSLLIVFSGMGSTGMNSNHAIYIVDLAWGIADANKVKLVGDDVEFYVTANSSDKTVTISTSSQWQRYLIVPVGKTVMPWGGKTLTNQRFLPSERRWAA